MKYIRKIYVVVTILMIVSLSCGLDKSDLSIETSIGLSIEDALFAKSADGGIIEIISEPVFEQGETVNFVLLNVGDFKPGEDGFHSFDMDIEIKDQDGEIIFSQKELLGHNGHISLSNNIATSPYGYCTKTSDLEPGKYRFEISIYDKIGNGKASKSALFKVIPHVSHLKIGDFLFTRTLSDGTHETVDNAEFSRGDVVNFVLLNVGKFKKDKNGLNWMEMDMEVKDSSGEIVFINQEMFGEVMHTTLNNDIAESPYAMLTNTSDYTPGRYIFKLTIYDKVGYQKVSKSSSFTLE